MIRFNDKEISAIAWGTKVIGAVYHGARLVWQNVRSCFGKGYWIGSKPWISNDNWK